MTIRKKIKYILAAALLCAVSVFSGQTFLSANAADTVSEFNKTNVLDDLESSEDFSFLRYPIDLFTPDERKIQVIEIVEYCYTYAVNSPAANLYGVYLYVYNPTLMDIDILSSFNRVLMAYKYDTYPVTEDSKPTEYTYFNLQFCSKVESGAYKNLYYKFKIVDREIDGKFLRDRVNPNGRRYDISGIEICKKGASNAVEYPVAMSCTFTGYSAECGPDAATDDITLSGDVLDTISLTLHDAFYRTGETSAYHRNQLNTVYFSVPERYFTEYGNLQKILAEWYEYKTDYIFISSTADDATAYPVVKPYIGVDIGEGSDDLPMEIYTSKGSNAGSGTVYGKVYNPKALAYSRQELITRIDWLLKTDKTYSAYSPTTEEMLAYMDWYKQNISDTDLILDKYPAELFVDSIDANRIELLENPTDKRGYMRKEFDAQDEFNLLSYDSTHSGWQRFWDKFGRWGVDTGGGLSYSPIQEVSAVDLKKERPDFCKDFAIDDMCYEAFKAFADNAIDKNERPVMFHFAATDYYSQAIYFDSTENPWASEKDGYIAQESVFLNFDIIQLTFNKDGVLSAIPVVASPIDIFPQLQPPFDDGTGNGNWWKWILALLGLILLVVILSPILPFIIQLLIWIVMLPFKAIAALFKAIQKAVNKNKKE